MAEVYLAVQAGPERFAKLVVQKRVRGEISRRPELAAGFLTEARLLARLSHPNLVQVLDLGWDERGPFVVVEYLSGETLSTVLRQMAITGQIMPWPLVTRVAASVAAGLAAAHGACNAEGRPDPILHRDVTPSNAILCYSGAVKVIDFGIAKLAAEVGNTKIGTVKGKLAYLAPEVLRGGTATRSSDMFQFGVLLFEALTARRLFDGRNDAARVQAVLHRPIPPPAHMLSGLPLALDRIAMRLLERDPKRRLADANAVRAELEDVLRRSGQHVGEHELGTWLRAALAGPMRDRIARERECLRALVEEPETPSETQSVTLLMPEARPRRRRVALIGGVVAAAALGASVVAIEQASHGGAAETREWVEDGTDVAIDAEPDAGLRGDPWTASRPDAGPARPDAGPARSDAGLASRASRSDAGPARRRPRRSRPEEPVEPAMFVPLQRRRSADAGAASARAPDAGASAGADAGASAGGDAGEPRTDNVDPWTP
jgi:eukaryotic-like serine/threonine-protein kinase